MDLFVDPLVISALSTGLLTVFNKLLEKGIVDPALESAAEPLRDWIARRTDQAKEQADLKKAVTTAIEDTRANLSNAQMKQYRFETALEAIKDSPILAAHVAAITVELAPGTRQETIPAALLAELKLDASAGPAFGQFLASLRRRLAGLDGFCNGIQYATLMANNRLLNNLSGDMRRLMDIYEGIINGRPILPDEHQAVFNYLDHVREQSKLMPLPLTRRNIPNPVTYAGFNDVYVPLTMRGVPSKMTGHAGVVSNCDPAQLTFNDIFNRCSCFVIKGPPGCGKTTLLRQAALAFAEGRQAADLEWADENAALLPIFLRLRNFGVFLSENRAQYSTPAHGSLMAFIENHFSTENRLSLSPGFFTRRLEEGRCLILLDGLDEVTEGRVNVANHVKAFIQHYEPRRNRFVLSSRPRGYDAVEFYLRRTVKVVVDVNPLTPANIRALINRLFNILDPVRHPAGSAGKDLADRILASPELRKIAGSPLFCTALVLVYKYQGANLPQRRVEVYQEIIDWLLGYWKASDDHLAAADQLLVQDAAGAWFASLSEAVEKKKNRLADVAFWMQEQRLNDAPKKQVIEVVRKYLETEEDVPPEASRRYAESFLLNTHEHSGLFVEAEADKFAFTHQGFREFLTATALKNKDQDDFIDLILAHVVDDWWEQVILLAGAYPGFPNAQRGKLVKRLLAEAENTALPVETRHMHLIMAGECAADMAGEIPAAARKQTEAALFAALVDRNNAPMRRLQTGLALDDLGWTPADLDEFVPVEGASRCWMAKYPVTNLQYQRFINSPDYNNPELWRSVQAFDGMGKPLHKMGNLAVRWFKDKVAEEMPQEVRPRYWEDPNFGAAHRLLPVVGITWYEAAAYCVWLSRNAAKLLLRVPAGVRFRLPKEQEWVAAAGGAKDGRFPWQDQPQPMTALTIPAYANTDESQVGQTTPVCMYPDGRSLAGVMDMSGNVCEWQAELFAGSQEFVLRGGAWSNGLTATEVALRIHHPADQCGNFSGFRVVGVLE